MRFSNIFPSDFRVNSFKKVIGALVVATVLLVAVYITYFFLNPKTPIPVPFNLPKVLIKPSPTPFVFRSYTAPKIEKKNTYTIFMVGDSMTVALGPHGGTFNTYINDLYKKDGIYVLIDNYAKASTNILTVNDQLTKKTTYWDATFEPLLSRDFDLILVESFAYNPLSELGLEKGVIRQNQALDELMKTLITTHPNSAIVFVATIAPNKENYAKKVLLTLSTADRILQAEERIAYLTNHINYAKAHNIPVVNIYDKSINAQGDGELKYINPDDYIHPSFAGVDFIGHEIANFIYNEQILPR